MENRNIESNRSLARKTISTLIRVIFIFVLGVLVGSTFNITFQEDRDILTTHFNLKDCWFMQGEESSLLFQCQHVNLKPNKPHYSNRVVSYLRDEYDYYYDYYYEIYFRNYEKGVQFPQG